ncbi:hypothetical protein [Xanthobacter sediminis]
MDPLDATPAIAERAGYERLDLRHCAHIVQIPIRMLPNRRLRDMQFRCKRCGALLEPEHVNARWTWQYENSPRRGGPEPTPWD